MKTPINARETVERLKDCYETERGVAWEPFCSIISAALKEAKTEAAHEHAAMRTDWQKSYEALQKECERLRAELSFAKEGAAAWEKNCKDAYAAQERADKELDHLRKHGVMTRLEFLKL